MYINKAGELLEELPERGFIPYDSSMMITKRYRVSVNYENTYGMNRIMGKEDFEQDPSAIQIVYCLLKYAEGREDAFATVETIYTLEERLPFMWREAEE